MRIVNGRVILGDRMVDADVVIDGDRIAAVLEGTDRAIPDGEIVDAQGCWVTPGLIDIHVHGGQRRTFNDAGAMGSILAMLAQRGVTSALPTLGTAPLDDMLAIVAEFAAKQVEWERGEAGARALGIHLEGPIVSREYCGAHREDLLREPADGSARALLENVRGIALVTLAPELPGGIELVGNLTAAGVVVSIGHSGADATAVRAAVAAGASHAAHLWSGQSSFHREGAWRVAGSLEVLLTTPGITAEVIADGHHLSPELIRIAYACCGENLVLVSDACSGAGLDEGERFSLMGTPCRIVDGAAMVEGRELFGGSTTYLDKMIPIAIAALGVSVPKVVAMVTTVPARVIGRTDIGTLAPGALADVAVFDDTWSCQTSIIGGRAVFDRGLHVGGDQAS